MGIIPSYRRVHIPTMTIPKKEPVYQDEEAELCGREADVPVVQVLGEGRGPGHGDMQLL